jgi:hypothetical protein
MLVQHDWDVVLLGSDLFEQKELGEALASTPKPTKDQPLLVANQCC